MKTVFVSLIAAGLIVAGSPAQASPPDPRPTVRIIDVEPIGPSSEGITNYRIFVETADPDGIVSELIFEFGDGATVFILLACTDPGAVVVQELEWSYAPGNYGLSVVGYSTTECFGGDVQQSRIDRERLRVA